jgi:FKBP-type peptidyl-prolyl cis-trans isomerase FkpA
MTLFSLAVLAAAAAAAPAPAPTAAKADPRIVPVPLSPVIPAAQRACAAKTESGLGYTALVAGAGAKPVAGDVALIRYIGYLAADGAVFDQSTAAPLPVDGVIPGFSEGLKLIPKGGLYRLCVPAAQGYGAEAAGQIPANSDLVFQVELLDKKTMAEVQAMQAAAEPAAAPAAKPTTP